MVIVNTILVVFHENYYFVAIRITTNRNWN